MKLKNPVLFILIAVFIILNLVDLVTAFFILPAESNPLYLLTGSFWSLIAIKLVLFALTGYVYHVNKFKTNFSYHSFVLVLVLGIFMLLLAAASNVVGILNNTVVEDTAQLSNQSKLAYYNLFVFVLFIIPAFLSMVAFKLYDISRDSAVVEHRKGGIIRKVVGWLVGQRHPTRSLSKK
ncbi:hypothetical protein CMI37_29800 [Candidatus Pacearchaeota archaeon]|nr:hypothetical protein [Candidatus Pacearchaeota archaeon]